MILSDRDIKKALQNGDITLDPFEERFLQPASVDLRLGESFLVFNTHNHFVIDVKKPVDDMMKEIIIQDDIPFVLHPNEFALGVTYEKIGVSDKMVGRLEGKSSLGRIGLIVHATAGYIDPGNCLHITLELHNIGTLPILLYHKMPIAQIAFTPLSSPAENPYGQKNLNSKYFGDNKPKASQMYKNFSNDIIKQKKHDIF